MTTAKRHIGIEAQRIFRTNKLAAQAANKVEDAACKVTDKLADKLDLDRPV